MAVSFDFRKTLHGSPDERFIQLVCEKHKIMNVAEDPYVSWESGKCRESVSDNLPNENSKIEEAIRPLSIKTGKNQYWVLDTAWGIFEFPNNKVSEIIENKFIDKYGESNISTHKYEFQNKGYLFVIRNTALILIYTTIMSNQESAVHLHGCKLYITANMDENMKRHGITDYGRPKHHLLIPDKYKIISDNINFNIHNQEYLINPRACKGISEINYTQTENKTFKSVIGFDDAHSKKFMHVVEGKFEKLTKNDLVYFNKVITFMKHVKHGGGNLNISVSINDSDKKELNTDDIIESFTNAQKYFNMI